MGIIPKNITYLKTLFNIQAYLENDFVNLCPCQKTNITFDEQMWCIKINFVTKKVTHDGKETKAMRYLLDNIDIEEVKSLVKEELKYHEKLKDINFLK
jgi:thiamine pyrophosphokinase